MYENQTISELILLIEESGWKRASTQRFRIEFENGDLMLAITAEDNDFAITWKSRVEERRALQLPMITRIDNASLYMILNAYGIVTLIALAAMSDLNVYDLLHSSTPEVV